MGIDYRVELACAPVRALSTPELLSRIEARGQADALLRLARREGDLRPPDQITLELVVHGPEGVEHRHMTLAALVARATPLDELSHHCDGCPANVTRAPFGCSGRLRYPILGETEDWLMSLLPDDLESTAGQMLSAAVSDFGWDGRPARRLRARGEVFFERREPVRRRWPIGGPAFRMDSDQLLHMILGLGPLRPAHALMLSLFLGVLPHDLPREELHRVAHDGARFGQLVDFHRLAAPEGQARDLGELLRAMCAAVALDVRTWIDG